MAENDTSVQISDIEEKSRSDETYKLLAETVSTGFPVTRHATDPRLRAYWTVRERLSLHGKIIMMDNRLVIPSTLKAQILNGLHAAHQGVSGMLSRAR